MDSLHNKRERFGRLPTKRPRSEVNLENFFLFGQGNQNRRKPLLNEEEQAVIGSPSTFSQISNDRSADLFAVWSKLASSNTWRSFITLVWLRQQWKEFRNIPFEEEAENLTITAPAVTTTTVDRRNNNRVIEETSVPLTLHAHVVKQWRHAIVIAIH